MLQAERSRLLCWNSPRDTRNTCIRTVNITEGTLQRDEERIRNGGMHRAKEKHWGCSCTTCNDHRNIDCEREMRHVKTEIEWNRYDEGVDLGSSSSHKYANVFRSSFLTSSWFVCPVTEILSNRYLCSYVSWLQRNHFHNSCLWDVYSIMYFIWLECNKSQIANVLLYSHKRANTKIHPLDGWTMFLLFFSPHLQYVMSANFISFQVF